MVERVRSQKEVCMTHGLTVTRFIAFHTLASLRVKEG